MKEALGIGVAFVIALAAIVGSRLSNEALAVIVGALCGISASIPITLGLVIAISQNWGRSEPPREIGYDYGAHRFAPQPPVIVVAPPQMPMQAPYGTAPNSYYLPTSTSHPISPREFKIIGDE